MRVSAKLQESLINSCAASRRRSPALAVMAWLPLVENVRCSALVQRIRAFREEVRGGKSPRELVYCAICNPPHPCSRAGKTSGESVEPCGPFGTGLHGKSLCFRLAGSRRGCVSRCRTSGAAALFRALLVGARFLASLRREFRICRRQVGIASMGLASHWAELPELLRREQFITG